MVSITEDKHIKRTKKKINKIEYNYIKTPDDRKLID